MGRPNNFNTNNTSTSLSATTNLGGFGQASFGSSTGGSSSGTGVFGGTATSSSSRASVGNSGGSFGGGGSSSGTKFSPSSTNQTATRVSYVATVKFPTRTVQASQRRADLQAVIYRSSTIKNPAAIQVEMEDGVVVLKGRAASDDEKRLAEGLIRLTAGVRLVRNEIEAPGESP